MSRYLIPEWPIPAHVRAVITTRRGGASTGAFSSFNLATHVHDHPEAVALNRQSLVGDWQLARAPVWLEQVHSDIVIKLDDRLSMNLSDPGHPVPVADASVSRLAGQTCVVMTADCLPVLLCDAFGEVVGAAHAGWRGLAGGILRNTVAAMTAEPSQLLAYLGPAIGPETFEVGAEVRDCFIAGAIDRKHTAAIGNCFRSGAVPGKLWADIYGLARAELAALGVTQVYGGDYCTFSDAERFYSYRRDGVTGRMASLIWRTV